MRVGEIRALTGLRFVAAFWVVSIHAMWLIDLASPRLGSWIKPITNSGGVGVDMFYILSGFVITLNYVDKMGERFRLRDSVRFVWLRLARVWPVYLVMLHLSAFVVILRMQVGHLPPAESLSPLSYIQQLLMIQLWSSPRIDFTSWDDPAWSISAEWLAYLLFPLLVLLLARLERVAKARTLLIFALLAELPHVFFLLGTGYFYSPYSWLPRILMQFSAGALACLAVRRMTVTDRLRRVCGYLSLAIVVLIVGGLYLLHYAPIPRIFDSWGLVTLAFVPLVVTLAIGSSSLPRLLATRPLVTGGQISYSLYLVHAPFFVVAAWWYGQWPGTFPSGWGARALLVGILVACVGAAWVMYHRVEEPSRKAMRRMLDARTSPPITRTVADEPPVVRTATLTRESATATAD